MAVTLPRFIWGLEVGPTNYSIPFDRGGNLEATLPYGVYTPKELAAAAEDALNLADPGQSYTCTFDFATRKWTFDNGATSWALEWSRNTSTNAAGLFGFDDADTASSAADKVSTDEIRDVTDGSSFSTAFTWAPAEPIALLSPITAAADGTEATLMQLSPKTTMHRSDGGSYEATHHSIDKLVRMQFKWVGGDERTYFYTFLKDWALKGKRFTFQPDKTSTNAVRLMMFPGEIAHAFSWLTRPEIDFPELTFVEALTRA